MPVHSCGIGAPLSPAGARLRRLQRRLLSLTPLLLLTTAPLAWGGGASHKGAEHGGQEQPAALIRSAESAAPIALSRQASVVLIEADGSQRILRRGSNNFTCMPDNPATPGPDPMCGDTNAMEWAGQWIGHKPPNQNKPGFMYMLAGGSDASNTDPWATVPPPGRSWVETGPHVMVVGIGPQDLAGYPDVPQPDTRKPYVMFGGTPYAHLMLPVR